MEQIRDRILKLERIEWRRLKELQPPDLKHVLNSKHIRQSIQKNGFAFPFAVWQDATGDIYAIDGHTRKDVLHGMDNVPDTLPAFFIAADDREDAIRILLEVYNQRHNEINPDVLTEWLEVEDIAVEAVNIGSLDTAETKQAKTEVIEDEYDDTLPEHPATALGDLYEIGVHRLLCGDSTDSDKVARLMNGEKAEMVFTDPPYEIDFDYSNAALFSKDAHIFIFNNDRAIIRQLSKSPFEFKGFFVFNHSGTAIPQEGGHEVFLDHILISHEVNGNPSVRYNKGEGTRTVIRGEYRHSENHKHEKPNNLLSPIVKGYSNTRQIVLDFFSGGGSLMATCEQLDRKCYSMELDPKHCDVIVKRMIKLNPALTIKRNGKDVTEFWKEKAAQT